ncbi:GAF domain-containing protein [Salinibacter ruber]|uniref:cache domain-containing protein n=1 Tax=Salinibacter ruber TaxID=146919 RepID=UPI0016216093|nr:GAF domain-containing protein [Salinibacter ruber]MBB4061757.1 hypothetical protein [Salinibacter ruber]
MPRLRDLSIRAKLLLTLLGIGGLSVGIMGWIGYSSARQRLESEALGRLAGVQANKANAVEAYVEDLRRQVVTTSKDDQTVRAMQKFRSAFRVLDARNAAPIGGGTAAVRTYYEDEFGPRLEEGTGTDGAAASYVPEEGHIQYLQNKYIASNPHPVGEKDRLDRPGEGWEVYHVPHARYHDAFRRLLHAFNHADLFLVEPDNGHVVYSVQKEVDFGTSLLDGPYRDSNLAEAFRAARGAETGDAHRMVDFAAYGPSHGTPASFVASPIMDAGEVIGVLVFQVSVGEINETLTGGQDWAAEGSGRPEKPSWSGQIAECGPTPASFWRIRMRTCRPSAVRAMTTPRSTGSMPSTPRFSSRRSGWRRSIGPWRAARAGRRKPTTEGKPS